MYGAWSSGERSELEIQPWKSLELSMINYTRHTYGKVNNSIGRSLNLSIIQKAGLREISAKILDVHFPANQGTRLKDFKQVVGTWQDSMD